MEEKMPVKMAHKMIWTNRSLGSITGVRDVVSFDEKEVVLETDQCMLTIKGQELHVKRLTLEKGELDLEGLLEGMSYAESRTLSKQGESLFNRLLK